MKLYQKFFFVIFYFFMAPCHAQDLVLDSAIVLSKQNEKTRLLQLINTTLKLPVNTTTEAQFESAFWAMMYLEHKPATVLPVLKNCLAQFFSYSVSFQNALLELVYSLYPKELEKEISVLAKNKNTLPKQFSVCAEYLYRINQKSPLIKKIVLEKLNQFGRLMAESENVQNKPLEDSIKKARGYLSALLSAKFMVRPPNISSKTANQLYIQQLLAGIRSNEIFPHKNILISLQNKNRDYPGIVLVRDSTGKFLLQHDTLFYTQQLARSITNLPFYISNGNTPQGIFRITGFDRSQNTHIGPTENFQLCMPNECKVADFFDTPVTDSIWSDSILNQLIPARFWDAGNPIILESYFAGELGRYEIIAHGSTVNPVYYQTKTYAGFTPTMGCLQTKEIWDYKTGKRTFSAQQQLIDAFKSIGGEKGYLLVLDILHANRPVNINDFKKLLP